AYEEFANIVAERHADTLYSTDGSTVDEQVAELLRGQPLQSPRGEPGPRETGDPARDTTPNATAPARRTIAVAESCTGGLLAARLTNPPGASEYMLGGIVAYANEVKIAQVGVPPETIEAHGAVSEEVAKALAHGARTGLGADVG